MTKVTSKLTVKQELKMLRSFVISVVGKDPEGEYRPEFVKRVLRATKERPTESFTTPQEFLKKIRSK